MANLSALTALLGVSGHVNEKCPFDVVNVPSRASDQKANRMSSFLRFFMLSTGTSGATGSAVVHDVFVAVLDTEIPQGKATGGMTKILIERFIGELENPRSVQKSGLQSHVANGQIIHPQSVLKHPCYHTVGPLEHVGPCGCLNKRTRAERSDVLRRPNPLSHITAFPYRS